MLAIIVLAGRAVQHESPQRPLVVAFMRWVLKLLAETRLQPRAKSPPDSDFGAISQQHDVVSVGILPQLVHEVDVHDRRAMNAHETTRVEGIVE
jgi:hypothetical protein